MIACRTWLKKLNREPGPLRFFRTAARDNALRQTEAETGAHPSMVIGERLQGKEGQRTGNGGRSRGESEGLMGESARFTHGSQETRRIFEDVWGGKEKMSEKRWVSVDCQ